MEIVTPIKSRVSLEDFEAFIHLPENVDLKFDYIDGEIIEVPSNAYCSEIAMIVVIALGIFLKANKIAGHVTGEAGGYMIAGSQIAPDVAYISAARQPKLAKKGYNPNPPELAVEVVSPSDKPEDVAKKLKKYDEAGVLLWVAYAERKVVEVRKPGQPVQTLGLDGTLDGGEVLPGFTLAVRDLFPEDES
jgi:Uma2 family endonuclease